MDELAPKLTGDCLVVGKSTVPVGTAALLADRLGRLTPVGVAAGLAWNPEFLREGFAVRDTLRPDRLVVGVSSAGQMRLSGRSTLRSSNPARRISAPIWPPPSWPR